MLQLFFRPEFIPWYLVAAFAVIYLFMRPRRFYFVRHGETVLNARHIRQGAEGGLSAAGQTQAERVGTYFEKMGIRRIVASHYERAKETAIIINAHLHVPIRYSPLLVERRNPSEIVGKNDDAPEVMRIVDQIELAYHSDDYRFSDEENFIDLKKRARACARFLARGRRRRVVVVTHHVFLKMLLAYLLYYERLHAPDFVKLAFFNTSDNASITICDYHPWKRFTKTRGWQIVSFNEHP